MRCKFLLDFWGSLAKKAIELAAREVLYHKYRRKDQMARLMTFIVFTTRELNK